MEVTAVHRTPSATVTSEEEALVNPESHGSVELGVMQPTVGLSQPTSIEEYRTRQVVTSEPDSEMEQAVHDLMRAAGYSYVATDSVNGASPNSISAIKEINRRVQRISSEPGEGVTGNSLTSVINDDMDPVVPQPVGQILPLDPGIWHECVADTEVSTDEVEDAGSISQKSVIVLARIR